MIRKTMIVMLTLGAMATAALSVLSFFEWPTCGAYDAKFGTLALIELDDGWVRFRTDGAVVEVTHRDAFFKRITWQSSGKEYFAKVGWTSYMTEGIDVRRNQNMSLPFWPVPFLLGLYPGLVRVRSWRNWLARSKPNHCTHCGYNLTGNVTGVCSECGENVDGPVASEDGSPPAS